MLKSFQTFHKKGTKQIGQFFCIPAAMSNALRILGDSTFTQERIRDEYYQAVGQTPEPSIDEQMHEADFGVVTIITGMPDFSSKYKIKKYEYYQDNDIFDYAM